MKINDFFDKIYCINLDRRTDRWIDAQKEINKHSLNVDRFSGINGNPNNNEKLNGATDGDIGCTLSHYNVIKDAKENDFNQILVLEDDVIFSENLNEKFGEYLKFLPSDWDMIYFGGNHNKHMGNKINFLNDKIIRLNETYGIHCVAINNSVYDLILNVVSEMKKPIDVYYADIQKSYNCYGFNPSVALQRESFSDIQNKNVNYKWLF